MTTDPDETLIADLRHRALGGDASALEDLLREVTPLISRRCSRLLPCPDDAQEATQDALMSIASKLDTFRDGAVFAAWATVIASNSARSTYRRLKRHAQESPHEMATEKRDPRTTSVIAGTRLDLLDALEGLEDQNPDLAQAVVLRDLAGLPYEEIAEQLGQPLGTVKAWIHRGRQFIRARLTENLA